MPGNKVFKPRLTLEGKTVAIVATLPGIDWKDDTGHSAVLVQQAVAAVARTAVAYGAKLVVIGDMDISLFVAQTCYDLRPVSGVENHDEGKPPIQFIAINFDEKSNFKKDIAFFESANLGQWKYFNPHDIFLSNLRYQNVFFENNKPSQVFAMGNSPLIYRVWYILDVTFKRSPPFLLFKSTGSKPLRPPLRDGFEPRFIETKFNLEEMMRDIGVLDWTQAGEKSKADDNLEKVPQIEPYYPYEILAQHALLSTYERDEDELLRAGEAPV